MAKLISFTEDFECITVFSLLLGNGKHFPFHHFRRTEVIPLDYTGYRNFHRHNSAVVFATTFKRKPNRVHNQLLIINNSKWKSITFGCIGEWLSIFLWLGYANQYQSIGFCCFLLIIYNGNWTEWSAIWSEIIRVISRIWNHKYDFRPKLHDTKFNYHFITSILKSQNLVSTNILLIK